MLLGTVTAFAVGYEGYPDVKTSRWSAADIQYVTEKGLMNGTNGKFDPTGKMTRAMVVTVLWRLAGSPQYSENQNVFSDVKNGQWYTIAVVWAQVNDIVNGVGDGKFAPTNNVTREQLAAIIMRYAEYRHVITDAKAEIKGYADYKKVHDYALDAMSWANAVGLVTGVTATELNPRGTATREQFAAIMHRFDTTKFEYEVAYEDPVLMSHYTEKEYPLVEDADFYVSTKGSDSNPGTKDKPFRTFEKARDAVRTLNKAGERKVAFFAGEYGNLNNITFTAEDAGTAESPITYQAYGDGEVLFSNGIVIRKSEFKKIDSSDEYLFKAKFTDSIYKADLTGRIDKMTGRTPLFSSTGVCWEARIPNKSSNGIDACYKDMTTTHDPHASIELQGLLPGLVERFRTVEGAKATGFLRTGYTVDCFPIKSYDPETHILTFDFENTEFMGGAYLDESGQGGSYNIERVPLAYEGRMHDTVFFSNLSDQLDEEGEYWFDPATKTLYVYAPQDDYAIPTGGAFMTIEQGAEYLNFVGLSFNGTTADAITNKADHVTFDRLVIRNVGGSNAINNAGVEYVSVINSEFTNFVDTGVVMKGKGKQASLENCHNVVDNNWFHDFSKPEYWSQAVYVLNSVGASVTHNEFVNGAHGGITFDACIDLVIEYNLFDNMMKTTQDYGAIYSFRGYCYRDNVIRYNVFKNIRSAGGQYGAYLDGCCGVQVYGNIFYEAGDHGVVMNGGRDNVVRDNIFVCMSKKKDHVMYNDYYHNWDTVAEYIANGEFQWNFFDVLPKEGAEGYEEWQSRWPILFEYTFEPHDMGDPTCYFTTVNYLKNNAVIGREIEYEEEWVKEIGVFENEKSYPIEENPFFVNPAIGDYRLRDDADFMNIPYEEIGRY